MEKGKYFSLSKIVQSKFSYNKYYKKALAELIKPLLQSDILFSPSEAIANSKP
jgi:hypothetical protein